VALISVLIVEAVTAKRTTGSKSPAGPKDAAQQGANKTRNDALAAAVGLSGSDIARDGIGRLMAMTVAQAKVRDDYSDRKFKHEHGFWTNRACNKLDLMDKPNPKQKSEADVTSARMRVFNAALEKYEQFCARVRKSRPNASSEAALNQAATSKDDAPTNTQDQAQAAVTKDVDMTNTGRTVPIRIDAPQVSQRAQMLADAAGLPHTTPQHRDLLESVLSEFQILRSRYGMISRLLIVPLIKSLRTTIERHAWEEGSTRDFAILVTLGPFMGSGSQLWTRIVDRLSPAMNMAWDQIKSGQPVQPNRVFDHAKTFLGKLFADLTSNNELLIDSRTSLRGFVPSAASNRLEELERTSSAAINEFRDRIANNYQHVQDTIQQIIQDETIQYLMTHEPAMVRPLETLDGYLASTLGRYDAVAHCLRLIVASRIKLARTALRNGTYNISDRVRPEQAEMVQGLCFTAQVIAQVVVEVVTKHFMMAIWREVKGRYLPTFALFNGDSYLWWHIMQPLHLSLAHCWGIPLDSELLCLPTGTELDSVTTLGTLDPGSTEPARGDAKMLKQA
jgi:hypothetical protein